MDDQEKGEKKYKGMKKKESQVPTRSLNQLELGVCPKSSESCWPSPLKIFHENSMVHARFIVKELEKCYFFFPFNLFLLAIPLSLSLHLFHIMRCIHQSVEGGGTRRDKARWEIEKSERRKKNIYFFKNCLKRRGGKKGNPENEDKSREAK